MLSLTEHGIASDLANVASTLPHQRRSLGNCVCGWSAWGILSTRVRVQLCSIYLLLSDLHRHQVPASESRSVHCSSIHNYPPAAKLNFQFFIFARLQIISSNQHFESQFFLEPALIAFPFRGSLVFLVSIPVNLPSVP